MKIEFTPDEKATILSINKEYGVALPSTLIQPGQPITIPVIFESFTPKAIAVRI